MLQTITFLRSRTGNFGAVYQMCAAFGLTADETDKVIRDLYAKGFTV